MTHYRPIKPAEYDAGGGSGGLTAPGWFAGDRLANWGQRMGSAFLDYGAPAVFVDVVLFWVVDPIGIWLFLVLANSGVLQGLTGQSLGKYVMGTTCVRPRSDPATNYVFYAPPGVVMGMARVLFHALDLILFIGFAAIATHPRRASFADRIAGTIVLRGAVETVSAPGPRAF